MRWTIDGSAINRIATESSNYNTAFDALTDMIANSELCFCDEVVDELERTAENEPGALWAATVKGQRQHTGASMTTIAWIARNVKDVVDPAGRHDAMPSVLAHAYALGEEGQEITVVTEDILEKPTRRALSHACDELSIEWVQVPEWLTSCGLPWP